MQDKTIWLESAAWVVFAIYGWRVLFLPILWLMGAL